MTRHRRVGMMSTKRLPIALDLHPGKAVFRMRVRSQRLHIRFQTGDHVLCLVDLLREFAQEVVFQPVT